MQAFGGGLKDVLPTGTHAGGSLAQQGVPVDPAYMDKMTNLGLAGITVYHGSPKTFDKFIGDAHYFTPSEQAAYAFTDGKTKPIAATLKMKNPLIVKETGESTSPEMEKYFIKEAKRLGHDSIVYESPIDPMSNRYVVFDDSQIARISAPESPRK